MKWKKTKGKDTKIEMFHSLVENIVLHEGKIWLLSEIIIRLHEKCANR